MAAINDETADSSIGNVTGSNSVNVFLGIGLAWSTAAIYHTANGRSFEVNEGALGFSVMLFCIFALVAIGVMMLRRNPKVGGELGGPRKFKIASAALLIGLWVFYIIISSLVSYCHIRPGF